jgi:predicted chitinase
MERQTQRHSARSALPIDSLTHRPQITALDNAAPDSTQSASLARAMSSTPQLAPDSVTIANPTYRDGLRNAAKAAPHATTTATSKPATPPPVNPKRRAELVDKLVAQVPPGDRKAAKTAIPAILKAAHQNGVTDPNQIGYMLATAGHESHMGRQMEEIGSTSAQDKNYGNYDGNTQPHDGSRYHGRGYVQTTYEGRYADISQRLGLGNELVANPQKLTEPHLAASALVVGIKENRYTQNASAALNKTIPSGNKPGDADFYHARGLVNGIDTFAAPIAASATKFAQILDGYKHSVLGVPEAK